jgi:hypothetical protein
MQFTRVNSNPDETNGLLGVIDKVGLNHVLGLILLKLFAVGKAYTLIFFVFENIVASMFLDGAVS